MNFKYKGYQVEKKTKKSLVVDRIFIQDTEGMICHAHAYIDLFFAEAWQDLQRQTGLVKDNQYNDAIGLLLLEN